MRLLAVLFLLAASFARAEGISIFLDEAPLADLVRIAYGEIARRPYVMSPAVIQARQPFTVSLKDASPSRVVERVEAMLASAGFKVETRAGVALIDKAEDLPEELLVYKPRHRSARYLADVVQPLTGAKSLLSRSIPQPGQLMQPKRQDESPTSVAGMTDRGEVDQIAFSVPAKDAARLRKLLEDLDTPAGEVLLKAAVYEVGTTSQEGSAVKLALSLAGLEVGVGGEIAADASIKLKLKGLEGVISALDRDSRFKSMSRPRVRVKNGSQARFSVGQDVPILGAQQLDRNGNPIQSIDYKPSGIILSARPEIRGEVIELDLTQELSSFVATNTGVNNSPTLIKRSVSTRLSLEPGEVVILAGLQEDKQDEQESRLPLVGWLLGGQSQTRRSEILVFIEADRI